MAGYSNKPLFEKLGIKPSFYFSIQNAPGNYLQELGMSFSEKNPQYLYEFIQFFTKSRIELEEKLQTLKDSITQNGMIWISWPKKSSRVSTDLIENIVREFGLRIG